MFQNDFWLSHMMAISHVIIDIKPKNWNVCGRAGGRLDGRTNLTLLYDLLPASQPASQQFKIIWCDIRARMIPFLFTFSIKMLAQK